MNSEYFLTRQTANLLEDFVREISQGSSLYLLYGDTGVGKSRLLAQLLSMRLVDQNYRHLDFAQNDESRQVEIFEQLARDSAIGDVIAIDHFETASNRAQDQVFKSWLTDGRDKNLNFIVVATSTSFNAFRQLAQRYQVEARSFQLMPCTTAEIESYLHFRLYPDVTFNGLSMPSSVRKQVRQSHGVIARLNEIVEREGSSIIPAKTQERKSINSGMIAGLMILIVAIGGYFYLQKNSIPPNDGVEASQALSKSGTLTPPTEDDFVADEIESIESNKSVVALESEQDKETESRTEAVDDTEASEFDEPSITITEPVAVEPEIATSLTEAPPIIEPKIAEQESSAPAIDLTQGDDSVELSGSEWFQQILKSSLDWIRQSDGRRGTIQLMSIGFDRFDESAFQAYFSELTASGIDIEEIRIFKTRAGEQEVYSIIYGEFEDRQQASQQIPLLPEDLGADSPIPRSAGSIAREIARNEDL